jgi:hypothetical protein
VAGAEGRVFARWAIYFEEQKELSYRAGIPRLGLQVTGAVFPVLATLILYALVSSGGTIHPQWVPPPPPTVATGSFLAFAAAFTQFIVAAVAFNGALISLVEIVPLYERALPIARCLLLLSHLCLLVITECLSLARQLASALVPERGIRHSSR